MKYRSVHRKSNEFLNSEVFLPGYGSTKLSIREHSSIFSPKLISNKHNEILFTQSVFQNINAKWQFALYTPWFICFTLLPMCTELRVAYRNCHISSSHRSPPCSRRNWAPERLRLQFTSRGWHQTSVDQLFLGQPAGHGIIFSRLRLTPPSRSQGCRELTRSKTCFWVALGLLAFRKLQAIGTPSHAPMFIHGPSVYWSPDPHKNRFPNTISRQTTRVCASSKNRTEQNISFTDAQTHKVIASHYMHYQNLRNTLYQAQS